MCATEHNGTERNGTVAEETTGASTNLLVSRGLVGTGFSEAEEYRSREAFAFVWLVPMPVPGIVEIRFHEGGELGHIPIESAPRMLSY